VGNKPGNFLKYMTENSSPALNSVMPVELNPSTPLHLSKKRYQLIREAAEKFFTGQEEMVECFLKEMCEIMKFNPDIGLYTPERGRMMVQRVKEKAAALGISVYEASGAKKYYLEHKEELNRKRNEYYHRTKHLKSSGKNKELAEST
jgi:hypothetical protein